MNQAEFKQERMIAEENASVSAERGISWAVISLGLIMAIIIIGSLVFVLSPKPTLNPSNQNSATGAPVDGR